MALEKCVFKKDCSIHQNIVLSCFFLRFSCWREHCQVTFHIVPIQSKKGTAEWIIRKTRHAHCFDNNHGHRTQDLQIVEIHTSRLIPFSCVWYLISISDLHIFREIVRECLRMTQLTRQSWFFWETMVNTSRKSKGKEEHRCPMVCVCIYIYIYYIYILCIYIYIFIYTLYIYISMNIYIYIYIFIYIEIYIYICMYIYIYIYSHTYIYIIFTLDIFGPSV